MNSAKPTSTASASGLWLSERVRVGVSYTAATISAITCLLLRQTLGATTSDVVVLVLLSYLFVYFVSSSVTFSVSEREQIAGWAEREHRGSFIERYVLGSAPGPGISLFFALAALWVAAIWLPGVFASGFGPHVRIAVALAVVSAAWACVVVSFAVTFYADNLMEDETGLDVANTHNPQWSDYVYFALSVMTTFGTTDVTVNSAQMRRTVSVNAVIAFIFNTFVIAALVTALTAAS